MSIKTEQEFVEVLILEAKKTQKDNSTALDVKEFVQLPKINNYFLSIKVGDLQERIEKVVSTLRAITYTGNAKRNPKGTIKGSVKIKYPTGVTELTEKVKQNRIDASLYETEIYNRLGELLTSIKSNKPITAQAFMKAKKNKEIVDYIIQAQGSILKAEIYLGSIIQIFNLLISKEKKQVGKYKRSGHLTDQILKYTLPAIKEKKQLSIWDILGEGTKTDLETANIERSEVVEGIKLSPTENKLIDSLSKLLHDKSENLDNTAPNYYTGTEEIQIVNYSNEKTPLPRIAVTLYELTQIYKGDKSISGKDVENVKAVLTDLNERKFLIKYTETTKDKKGNYIKKEVEGYRNLIEVDKATLTLGTGDVETYKKTETIITLNPIFRRQIDTKFILYPNDINKRTAIAYGGASVSGASLKLRDYLMREHSSKRYTPEISLYNLSYLLAENLMKGSRKSDAEKAINKALITCKNLGILESYTITENKIGEPKYIFKLKKDWE